MLLSPIPAWLIAMRGAFHNGNASCDVRYLLHPHTSDYQRSSKAVKAAARSAANVNIAGGSFSFVALPCWLSMSPMPG